MFSLMTSFTPCYQDILYTRAPVEREGAGQNRPSKEGQDGMENGDVQEQRVRFVVCALRREKNFRQLCQEFDISRPAGYQWLRRYQAGGIAAIVEKSRRPQHSPRQTTPEIEQRVVALRQQRPDWERVSYRCCCNKQESICRSSPCIAFCCDTIW